MVEGKKKSRTYAQRNVSVVSGTTKHFNKRNPHPTRCPETNQQLHGIPRGRPVDMKRLTKSQRRPDRPYGGVLSSKAMRKQFKAQARSIDI
jgi:large subunit ribosomal protein L34e